MSLVHEVAISGAGIGGLSAALSLAKMGVKSVVFERQEAWSEVGAGLQLGPNATRRLRDWGLEKALQRCASWPERIEVIDGSRGGLISALPLGERCQTLYGAPYATLLRADLQGMLREGVQENGLTQVRLGEKLLHATLGHVQAANGAGGARDCGALEFDVQTQFLQKTPLPCASEFSLHAESADLGLALAPQTQSHGAQALIGADGVFSGLRQSHFEKTPLQYTGQLAYRALVAQADLPASMRSNAVRLFLAPKLHWVQYPVRGGEWLNVVVLLEVSSAQAVRPDQQMAQQKRFLSHHWDEVTASSTNGTHDIEALQGALERTSTHLRDIAGLVPTWSVWPLFAAAPVRGAQDMAHGRLALLGDAAHPMLPYLAQGAGMSIEDAQVFALCWGQRSLSVQARLTLYAQMRWQRCAQVQRRALLNARLFHWGQPLGFMRDTALRIMGERLMDLPWLYSG